MYESNHDVIETLCSNVPCDMYHNSNSPEAWLADVIEDDGLSAWQSFTEEHCASDYDSLEDFTDAYQDYESEWKDNMWESDEITEYVNSEVEETFGSVVSNMDADEKFEAIKALRG